MPKSNIIEEDEEEVIEEPPKKSVSRKGSGRSEGVSKRVLELAKEEDDIFDILLSSNSKLAGLYLIAEKAAERAVMDLFMKMNFMMNQNRGSSDEDELKKFILEKLRKEEEERRVLKQTLLPLITEIITNLKLERAYNECVQEGLMRLMISGQVSMEALEKIREQCRQGVGQVKSAVSSLLSNQSEGGDEDVEI